MEIKTRLTHQIKISEMSIEFFINETIKFIDISIMKNL